MTIFKGDRVIRVDGTAVGFRRNGTYEAVDVSRTHIKVKNAAGLISKWFERKDFQFYNYGNQNRLQEFVVLAKARGQREIITRTFRSAFTANQYCREVEGAGNIVLAKKRITIPYQEIA